MNDLEQFLDDQQSAQIQMVRSAVRGLATEKNVAFDDQAERLLGSLSGWLLDGEQIDALNSDPWHVFFLIAAAYLCDIGLPNTGETNTDDDPGRHSHDRVLSDWRSLGLPDPDAAQVAALICLAVGSLNGNSRSQPITFDNTVVDVGLLASCLRLSKSLDLTALATLTELAALQTGQRHLSLREFAMHFDVIGCGPDPAHPATIRVTLVCRNDEVHRALKHHEQAVQGQLDRINRRIRPRFYFSRLRYEIEPQGYRPLDWKFSVDSSAALRLFTGNRLYADRRVFLRELIQNALDACSLRKLTDSAYQPEITVRLNDDVSKISVRDNGIGMDRHWVEKYFLSIGISFYQSDEIQDAKQDARLDVGFISQFGIGFLSSFMVADKIVIRTRKKAMPGLMITIFGLKDYFDVRVVGEDFPVGTEVTLHLKENRTRYCRSLEYVGYLRTTLRYTRTPIALFTGGPEKDELGGHPLSYAAQQLRETDFVAALDFDASEGYLLLTTKMTSEYIFALETAKGGIAIFQDGIFVTQIETLLPEGARGNVVGRIDLRAGEKCELSMDRNRLFWTPDQKQRVMTLIRHALVDLCNQVVSALERQKTPAKTRRAVVNHLGVFFDFAEVDDWMYNRLSDQIRDRIAKKFRNFIRINFAHTRRREGIPEADGYSEAWQQDILSTFVHRSS